MAADIPATLATWSTTVASNQPDSSDSMLGLADNLKTIQSVVKYNVAGSDTIASASTCDIGSKESSYLSVTGTTTITSLGSSGYAGQVKTLYFPSALTITHNATSLILPGGVSRTTTGGETGIFRCEGSGNWRCIYLSPTRGTWTPTFSSSGCTFSYATQVGVYQIDGNHVTCQCSVQLAASGSVLSGSSNIYINLPFSVASSYFPLGTAIGAGSFSRYPVFVRAAGSQAQLIGTDNYSLVGASLSHSCQVDMSLSFRI